jgi:putative flippase GtrA/glycosyltransferase involved in cell wall biosynthesis
LTSREREFTGRCPNPPELVHAGHAASQAEGLRALLEIAVERAGTLVEEAAMHDGRALTVLENLAPAPDVPASRSTEPASQAQPEGTPKAGRAASKGRHAATPPPYLERRGARFVVFSAIGGAVFVMGLGLQAVLTGAGHMQPIVSYAIQAVVSVESSFLLNRWLTWRDRATPFRIAFARFNAQKAVTIALNLALYEGLLRLGMNYLVANVALTAVFTVVNYVAGDRLVFIRLKTRTIKPVTPEVPDQMRTPSAPWVSVVIPCRDNAGTIGAAVKSLLDQNYPRLQEIILVGSPGDRTWEGLAELADPRLVIYELETPPGVRDANFKRDAAIRMTSGDLIALVDSDIVLPRDWMSRAVTALRDSGTSCVAGGMKSVHDSFWGRYTDSTWIGAKTPRITQSYTVTSEDFGARGRKPPITANTLFTRELYEACPIDPSWSHGSYEDYEWFWRVTTAGYGVFVCRELFGWHDHRRGLRALTKEYRRSSRGCAYFIRAHRDCPFAKRRLRQLVILPLAGATAAAAAAAAVAAGHSTAVAGLMLGCAAVLAVHQIARSRSLESLAYPLLGFGLGLVFITGLAMNLTGSIRAGAGSPSTIPAATSGSEPGQPARRSRGRLLYPLAAICALQVGLSLTLVWSNTAYLDEADYLWVGRLELAHWLHGTSWPSTSAYRFLSGSPAIYPPVGAFADSIGGLAGARILSLVFMLGATILLCLTASRLIGRTGALIAAALWALSEPAMRLAFATADPLSIFLTALAAWLIVQAGYRRHRGEFILAAALMLALANATAYWGLVIDPVVIAFAALAWLRVMRPQQSLSCTAWLTAAWALCFALVMTASHSWPGLFSTLFAPSAAGYQPMSSAMSGIWGYAGLIIGLAVIGALIILKSEHGSNFVLTGGLCFAVYLFIDLRYQTTWTIDKNLAYGVWFAAIAAGYAAGKLIRWVPGSRPQLAALCCAAALVYPAATGWESAWERYHAWPDAQEFISALKPIEAHSPGHIYLPGREVNIAEYYSREGSDWTRWDAALSLDPAAPQSSWASYYSGQLHDGNYGVIALFYSTTFSSVKLPGGILLSHYGDQAYQELLGLVGDNSGEPGLSALTSALEKDGQQYRLAAVGRYNTSNISGTHDYGIYAIWQRNTQT